jgi:type VI protein secretion system component VasK
MSLVTNLQNLATRIATETKSLRTLINGNAADLSALNTTAKTSLVAALNELKADLAAVAGSASGINDATTATTTTWSSSKIVSAIDALKDQLLGDGASEALDTIGELAAALQNNPNAITEILAGIGNRVRFDAAQTLTSPEQKQARDNIGAVSAADIGDTTVNFVTTFEAGLT